MAQFQALDQGVQVNGAAVLSIVEAIEGFRFLSLKMLAKQGIFDPKEGEWYPQQAWLNAFKDIAEKTGSATLRTVGRRIPEVALWPPDIDTIEKALASIDVAYHMNHRGGKIGHYSFKRTGARAAKMVCDNPYPDNFDMGIIEATAKKFAPEGAFVVVKHDDSQPCRGKSGDSCTYLVSW